PEVPEAEENTEVADVDEEPEYGAMEEGEEGDAEQSEDLSAPGPLPEIPGHTRSAHEQAAAQMWGDRIFDRVTELARDLGIDDDVAEELAQKLAHGLVREDYVGLEQARVEQDRATTRETKSELLQELGTDYHPQMDALRVHLADPTFFPNGAGELIAV